MSGFHLLTDILSGRDQSCQLRSYLSSLAEPSPLLGADGFLEESSEQHPCRGSTPWTCSAFLDPLTSQWSMPPSCGCQAPTRKSNELKPLPTGTLVCYLPVGHLIMGQVGPLGSVTYLGLPGLTSVDLPHHLVEPCGHMLLPLLLEMGLQDCAIPAGLHSCCPQASSQREWPVEKHWCCKAS